MIEHNSIGEYEITGLLGEGGVSKVYKVKKQGAFGFSKNFAIKVLLSKSGIERAHFQSTFVSEAKVLSFLNHPNIVQVYVVERMSAEGKFFHRACFRCDYCSILLRLGT